MTHPETTIISRVMAARGIHPAVIPAENGVGDPTDPAQIDPRNQLRYYRTKGYGHFRQHADCTNKHHNETLHNHVSVVPPP